eukprot:TRINITY_DN90017_c0_g1_i1.p1 TRINITY_DN90017_c0_g1~~TRINITY_DN90017_c0_g1_i1.p1  ORF type:complete len:450 (-),score=63.57 TRINITY_DN90017_c0_g1_i1:14-1363(-)
MARLAAASSLSWAELASRLQRTVADTGCNLHEVGRRGRRDLTEGPPSSQAMQRTFGVPEKDVRVTLYRDNHAWCPYCHKVWLQLEEKRVPYRVIKVSMNCYGTKSQEFLAKTSRGLLPALELDGQFYTESSRIMQLIEDNFPERPMMPSGRAGQVAGQLLKLERELFGAWLQWLRGSESAAARRDFEQAMDMTEKALEQAGPYFLGSQVSLVDLVFASSLERIAASIYYYKGLRVKGGRWQSVNNWFSTMERLDSYRATQSDFHTHVHDLPPQIGGCIASNTPEQKQIAAAIDGTDGRSWHLPLPPLALNSLEPGQENPVMDRLEAANALIHCHAGVVASSRGGPEADAAFRYVVRALLEGPEALQSTEGGLKHGDLPANSAESLRWTRDRISVPRDMSWPAARQLRAHLNLVADLIDPQTGWKGVPLRTGDRRDVDPEVFANASRGCL